MSVFHENMLLSPQASSSQYQIQRSLRFNSADSAYLSRTPASAGNRKTWTWSGWVKRSGLGTNQMLFSNTNNPATIGLDVYFRTANDIRIQDFGVTGGAALNSTPVFRDASAWYHIVIAYDTTQATNSSRVRLYVNGAQQEVTGTYPDQNLDGAWNSASYCAIGNQGAVNTFYLSGYLADIHFIDGQALTPSSFGETDATTGEWSPKAYTGTYGTNGFKLDFADNSSNTATTLGKDTSGNGNNWTPNNFSVIDGRRYSQNYVANTPSGNTYFSDGWARGFNSNLDDGVLVYNSEDTTLTLPSGVTWNSKIRIRLYWYGGVMIVNGTTLTGSFTSTPTWYDFTSQLGSSGTLNTIKITSVSSNYMAFCAVELDNVVLYDNSGGNDSLVDTPTSYGTDTGVGGEVRGNYCTWNPLNSTSGLTPANGSLELVGTSGVFQNSRGTLALNGEKFYWETVVASTTTYQHWGIVPTDTPLETGGSEALGQTQIPNSVAIVCGTGNIIENSNTLSSGSGALSTNTVIGHAFDGTTGKYWISINGTWRTGNPATGTTPLTTVSLSRTWLCGVSEASSQTLVANFGQRPFAYTAPSGFKALCDTNLPAPTIVKPSTVMDTVLYTGTGATLTPTSSLGFSPDLVWIKSRSAATDHALYDTVRGTTRDLASNLTTAETTQAQGLTAFNSNGFTVGTLAKLNTNTATYAAWCWDAGSSTVTNTAGTITSQVRANASAGFSIVTWTGNGVAGATVGHGLGTNVALYFCKNRSTASNWAVIGHALNNALGGTRYLNLNTTAAVGAASQGPGNSSTIELFNDPTNNANGNNHVAYCFAPVAGYSAFGSYTGNGSADGPFVFCNFRPRWIMVKRTTSDVSGGNWIIKDALRNGYNDNLQNLYPNLSAAEQSFYSFDILSNGFKVRSTDVDINGSAATYIYAAFAEFPFQYARAR